MISINKFRSLLLFAAALLASVCGPSLCFAWSLAAEPVDGILVLRNGNILRGKVQQLGEQYHVYLPNGKLQVRAAQVEQVCENLESAYQHRRKTRGGSSADSHLELAAWCLRHDLFDHAQAELREAQTTDPDHPRLGFLERQLKLSLKLVAREKEQQAAARIPTAPVEPLDETKLEKAPQWARALFVRQIQPLVVHSCATSGCHQSNSGENYKLNRLAVDGAGHPEATLRNLAATLEQIDWESAKQSSLLERARKAHGSESASTPLPMHKLKVLEGWITQLADAHQRASEIKLLPPVVEVAALKTTVGPILNPPVQTPPEQPGQVRQASFAPADPFDPSAFNQRYVTEAASLTQETGTPIETHNSVPHVLAPGEPVVIR